MRFDKTVFLAGALAILATMATGVSAQPVQPGSDWVQLGCQTVSFNVDRDILHVGQKEGRFRSIRLHASNGDVEMLNIKLVYGSGTPDEIPVRQVLRRGERTPAIDLKGATRNIRQVELYYRTLPDYKGREAVVCVEGRAAPAAVSWVVLGCQTVSFNVDRDILNVGRQDRRFRAIRLHAAGGDIELLDLRVIYGSGAPDAIPVRQVLRRGGRTPPIDLKGADRNIAQVEMFYRTLPDYRGRKAQVCVEGAQ